IQKSATERKKSKRSQSLFVFARRDRVSAIRFFCGRSRQQIRGDLLDQKLVVRLVLIESSNHVVTVSKRKSVTPLLATRQIAFGIREPCQIEPITSPSLAIMWRS